MRAGIASTFLISMMASVSSAAAQVEFVEMPVTFEQVLALDFSEPDERFDYGAAASQNVLQWRPRGQGGSDAPTVILLHGGCWLSQYSVDHIYPLASALADAGYAVWAPEYRRVGEPGGGWPGTFDDVAAAVELIVGQAAAGAVLIGHSAGGQLALWAAASAEFDARHHDRNAKPAAFLGVIGLAAITDLEAYAGMEGSCPKAVPQLMGGGPIEQANRYRQVSPVELKGTLATRLIQGGGDPIVPASQAHALPGARVRVLEEAGHFDLIHPGTAAFAALLEEMESMFAHE